MQVARTPLLRPHHYHHPFLLIPVATLVNVKLKWFKDGLLDSVVSRERHLRRAHHLLDVLSAGPSTASHLALARRSSALGFTSPSLVVDFLRRFPALFSSPSPSLFSLSPAASALRSVELRTLVDCESDLVDRLRRLLMLTAHRALPLHTIDQLSWDLGLPYDYRETLIPKFPQFFEIFEPPENPRAWVKLLSWDPLLAVSELERRSGGGNEGKGSCLAFPIRFPRGFGLKKKCMQWLAEWQTLPYTSPYGDCLGLDPRTDVAEKRNVGVFHELLHLTIAKKTERENVSNLRSALQLPQKFTKVFERHPGIFYLSHKMGRQTVVLREGYGGGRELLVKHPLQEIREQYVALLRSA